VDLEAASFRAATARCGYKDGVKYPVLGVDLSDDQINAIPAIVDQPVECVNELCAPAAAQPAPPQLPPGLVIDVGNSHPNERIPAGLNTQGVAYDPLACSGSEIDRVQVFMEDRRPPRRRSSRRTDYQRMADRGEFASGASQPVRVCPLGHCRRGGCSHNPGRGEQLLAGC
jgi:hypothetical protein